MLLETGDWVAYNMRRSPSRILPLKPPLIPKSPPWDAKPALPPWFFFERSGHRKQACSTRQAMPNQDGSLQLWPKGVLVNRRAVGLPLRLLHVRCCPSEG